MVDTEEKLKIFNKTRAFLLPILGQDYTGFYSKASYDPRSNFIGIFIGDTDKKVKDSLILLYKYEDTEMFNTFIEMSLKEHELYKGSYTTYNKKGLKLMSFVYEIPEECLGNYKLFLEGKYSRFEDSYKRHIGKFYNIKLDHPVMGTLYKTKKAKRELEEKLGQRIPDDLDLTSIINPFNENLSKKLLRKLSII